MAETKDTELIRHEIAAQRRLLADAVGELRTQVESATDINRRLRSRLVVLAPTAFVASFVASGGIGATMRYFARRGRDRR